ncbi:hypothetical protein GGF50DRAFT_118130 [Schizophyllum commune]
MLSRPQSGNAETFDGLPMMHFPDPPEEVLHWLKSMSLPAIAFPSVFAGEANLLLDKDHKRKTTIDGDFKGEFSCKVHALEVEIGAHWLLTSVIYTIHAGTDFDDEARARLPTLLASQDMLQLLNVTQASLGEFQPLQLLLWAYVCDVDGTKCRDDIKNILGQGLLHLIARSLSFTEIKATTFMTDLRYSWHATVEYMVGNAACNKCKGAFYTNYRDACYMFQHVFEGTRGEKRGRWM